ncbi:MAG TPA: hypothetical protein VI322_00485 [Candidatus Saccharimonadia bacterium]
MAQFKLSRHPDNPILSADSNQAWEAGSVFNGTVIPTADGFVMLYRATNDLRSGRAGGYVSRIGLATSTDGLHFDRRPEPFIAPDQPYEAGGGCEDPRVTFINGTYYIFYTAVRTTEEAAQVRIALATTKDWQTATKHGVVGPAGSRAKAAALLPEAVNGHYYWYFTWEADRPQSSILHLKIPVSADLTDPATYRTAEALDHYDDHIVIPPAFERGQAKIRPVQRGPELGAPPLRTPNPIGSDRSGSALLGFVV